MNMLKTFIAMITLLSTSFATQAHAIPFDLGVISLSSPTPFFNRVGPGSFTDTYSFFIQDESYTSLTVTNLPLTLPGIGNYDTRLDKLSLYLNPDGLVGNFDDRLLAEADGNDIGNVMSELLKLTLLSGFDGDMYLKVSGAGVGSLGGMYTGAIGISPVPSPVPAPATIWLLGTALVGMVVNNRKKYDYK